MKIGILIDRLNVGGPEKVAIQQVRALRDLGHDAHLLILRRRGIVDNAFEDIRSQIPIVYLDDRIPAFLRTSVRVPFFYFFALFHLTYPLILPWFVKRCEYDAIVSHNTYTSFTALALARFRRIPYGIYVWDPIAFILGKAYPYGPVRALSFALLPLARALDKFLVHNAVSVFVSGNLHYGYLAEITEKSRLHLLPPGSDCAPKLSENRGAYLLVATAWKEGKHLEDLLEVMAGIESAELKVAGRWLHRTYRRRIDSLIEQLGIMSRVEIVGEVSEGDLNSLYANARAAVIVNEERGFGLTAIEAASNGCTFIIPDGCGAAQFFEKDRDGFFFKDGDSAELGNYIRTLLGDAGRARSMGEHAWQTVLDKYAWPKHAESVIAGVAPQKLGSPC